MELFAADGHDAGGCERVTGKSGMRPAARFLLAPAASNITPPVCRKWVGRRPGFACVGTGLAGEYDGCASSARETAAWRTWQGRGLAVASCTGLSRR